MKKIERNKPYDPAVLARLHSLQVEMLQDLMAVCKKYNLENFAVFGTALGAVRHAGFIPWDDDIDVGMLREDYDVFIKIVEKEMGDKYQILTPEIDDRYACNVTKLQRKGTKFVSHLSEKLECEQCIFVDIFPFDCVAPTERKAKMQLLKTLFWDRLLYLCGTAYPIIPYTGIKYVVAANICRLVHYATKILRISPRKVYRIFDKECRRYNHLHTGKVTTFGNARALEFSMSVDGMRPIQEIPFENATINILHNTTEHLEKTYGDYMKLPPVENRINHAPYIIDFGD